MTIHGEVRCGECHESRDIRTSDGGLKLCGDENWLGELGIAATTVSGDDIKRDVHSLTLQGENPRSDLHWLCLAIALLKALFL